MINKLRFYKFSRFFPILLILMVPLTESSTAQSTVALIHSANSEISNQEDPYRSEFFRVDHNPTININTLSGDIEVVQNSAIEGVQIDLYVKREFSLWSGARNLDNYRIIIQKQGNSIIASVEDRRSNRSTDDVKFNFSVQVPKEASLNLRSINGKIDADNVEGQHYVQNLAGNLNIRNMTGEIRAISTAGDIMLDNLKGNIYAKTVSGDITADRDYGEIRLRTTTGDIVTSGISGTLVAASTSGDIQSDFQEVSIGVYLETTTGDIDLTLPKMAGYDIDARGLSFNFDELGDAGITKRVGFGNASVEIREGGIPVNLKTVAGSIKVRESQQ